MGTPNTKPLYNDDNQNSSFNNNVYVTEKGTIPEKPIRAEDTFVPGQFDDAEDEVLPPLFASFPPEYSSQVPDTATSGGNEQSSTAFGHVEQIPPSITPSLFGFPPPSLPPGSIVIVAPPPYYYFSPNNNNHDVLYTPPRATRIGADANTLDWGPVQDENSSCSSNFVLMKQAQAILDEKSFSEGNALVNLTNCSYVPILPRSPLRTTTEQLPGPSSANHQCEIPVLRDSPPPCLDDTVESNSKRSPLKDSFVSSNESRPLLDIKTPSPLSEHLDRDHPHQSLLPGSNKKLPILDVVERDNGRMHPIPYRDLTKVDVLLGRGGGTNHFAGNVWFRKLMEKYRNAYCTAPKGQKSLLARNLCNYVRLNGGRFLEQNDDADNSSDNAQTSSNGNKKFEIMFHNTVWFECGDARAHAKVGQTLREGIAIIVRETLKRNLQSTSNALSGELDIPKKNCNKKRKKALPPL